MKKATILNRIICLLLIVFFIAVPAHANNEADYELPVTNGCHSVDAQIPMLQASKEISNLYSAFLYDYNAETVIYSVNPDSAYDPGNLVKLMTGLIIAENANLEDLITVEGALLAQLPEDSYVIGLQAGEIISMRDLLYCILVESANDAAIVAANHISGSVDGFVTQMNAYAAELGCENTYFSNVHGLYDPMQFSTARDLAKILVKAFENEAFMDAFSVINYTVPATNLSEARELSNDNFMLNDSVMSIYLDYRVTGGRPAVTNSGERNLAVTAEQNGVELISIVMGSQSVIDGDGYSVITYGSFNETSALLNLGFSGHNSCEIFHTNQVLQQIEVPNGDCYLAVGIKDSVSALLPSGVNYNDLTFRYNEIIEQIQAPVKAGDKITTVQVWHDNLCLAVADLYALHDVEVKEFVEIEEPVVETVSEVPAVLITVLVIVGLLIVLLFGRRVIFRMIRKRKIQRSKKARRRNH